MDNPPTIRETALIGIDTLDGDTWTAPIVKETSTTVTCLFRRWQFPQESYTLDFDRETGKCLDKRINCLVLRNSTRQAELWAAEGGRDG